MAEGHSRPGSDVCEHVERLFLRESVQLEDESRLEVHGDRRHQSREDGESHSQRHRTEIEQRRELLLRQFLDARQNLSAVESPLGIDRQERTLLETIRNDRQEIIPKIVE